MAKMEYNRGKYPKFKTNINGFIRNPYNLQEKMYVELEDFEMTRDELILFNNFNSQKPATMKDLAISMSYSVSWISKIRLSMEKAIYNEFKDRQDLELSTPEELLETLEEIYTKGVLTKLGLLLQEKYLKK